ncbi:MAG: glycosyl transferase family 39, partial [Planctomycetota bacterium]
METSKARPSDGFARLLLIASVLTLVPRVVWALVVPFEPMSDSNAYFNFASTIVSGGGYGWEPNEPTAYWAVGPSGIYAAFFYVFGVGKLAVVLANLLASVSFAIGMVVLAERWFSRRAAWAAAWLSALWPTMVMYTTVLSSELFFAAMLVQTLVVIDPQRGVSWKRSVAVGPLVAAMAMVRPTGLLIPAAVAGIRWLRGGGFVRPIGAGLVTTAVMLVCIAPWTYRNYQVLGEPVLISTNGGPNFWMGNNPETTGAYMPLPYRVTGMSETERASVLKDEAVAYIRAEPVAFVKRTAIKMVRQHERETIGVGWNEDGLRTRFGQWIINPLKAASTGFWLMTLAGAFAGIVMLLRSDGFW